MQKKFLGEHLQLSFCRRSHNLGQQHQYRKEHEARYGKARGTKPWSFLRTRHDVTSPVNLQEGYQTKIIIATKRDSPEKGLSSVSSFMSKAFVRRGDRNMLRLLSRQACGFG